MYLFFKRTLDVLASISAIILLLPLFFFLCIFLKLSAEGEIFYFQERIGLNNKKFFIWKFATMLKNSMSMGTGSITLRNDFRVTKVGKYLRITKINELPQLFNILKGDISIVGPRPLVQRDFDAYSSKSIVESCLMLGADGIKVEVYPWCTKEDDYLKKYTGNESIVNAANLATECRKWNIPLMVESIPFGWPKADNRNPEIIAAAARVASELGADYVKTFYTGDKDSFSKVVQNSLVPVLVLGGPKIDSDLEVLQMVRDAIDAGAVGITMGRNIWGHPNVVGMSAALTSIIHDDASAETAYRLIQ